MCNASYHPSEPDYFSCVQSISVVLLILEQERVFWRYSLKQYKVALVDTKKERGEESEKETFIGE